MNVIDFQDAFCKHCYKCVRTCAVKAIRIKNEQAQIMNEYCVLCGKCMEICPQNAKTFLSDIDKVKDYIKQGKKTIVSIAPSYLGGLELEQPGQLVDALLKLGFAQVRETAEGAAYISNSYARILEEGQMKNIITTCCPSVNDLVEKYYPALIPYMAPVVSPMIAHGMMLKEMFGTEIKVVFIGPCIAKKEEALADERTEGYVDAVITFSELQQWLNAEQISLNKCDVRPMFNPDPKINQLYPISGGVIQSVLAKKSKDNYEKLFVDGIENCMELFESIERGEINRCFIEVNACSDGCINGSALEKRGTSRFKTKIALKKKVEYSAPDYPETLENISLEKTFYSRVNKEKMPSEEELTEILRSTGKYTKEQELNCAACGYSSCREKAVAVYQKKAEIGMCLPYAFEKAQSMANVVMETIPNVIVVVDADLRIREFNKKAETIFQLSKEEALQKYIFELMDASCFTEVLDTKKPMLNRKFVLEDLELTTLLTLVYMSEEKSVLAIFQDITDSEKEKLKNYNIKMETVEMAQNVIDKQMMVAQEIAGLLGETTAETKVILSKLRDSILFEEP